MTKEQYLDHFAERRPDRIQNLLRTENGFFFPAESGGGGFEAVPCTCAEPECQGWQMRLNLGPYPVGTGSGYKH